MVRRSCASSSWPSVCVRLAAGVLIGMGVCVSASAAPILETYGTSLTSYKARTTLIQGVRPTFAQRGVGLDGTLRAGPTFRWALAGNPSGDGWSRQGFLGSVRLDTGAYAPVDVDLSLPAKMPWTVGRTYNAVQDNSGHLDSNGYQGRNWFQLSQPEIVFFDADGNPATLQAADLVYLVYGADRYAEFKRTAANDATFKGQNGAAGVIEFVAGSAGTPPTLNTYVWTDQNGSRTYFFGDNTAFDSPPTYYSTANYQIWKVVDPEGNTAYVGDASSTSTAVTSGYTGGKISTAYDSSDRRYTYTYSTIDSVSRLTQVKCETKSGSTWASPGTVTTVGQVDYAYYQTGDNTEGDNGCLKLVTITTPTSGGTPNLVSKKYYRYWKGSFSSPSNPGNPYQIKLVLGFEGCRKYDWDQNSAIDSTPEYLSASTSALQSYSDAYLEYTSGSDYRIAKGFFNGECGCSGGNNGTYEFTYGNASSYATYTGNTSYDNAWATRVVVKQPDAVYFTQYFDEVGQPLARVVTSTDPATSVATRWVTDVQRDSAGCVTLRDMPDRNDASSGYNHSTGAITAKTGTGPGAVLGLCVAVDRTGTPTGLDGFATGSTAQVLGTATGCDASPVYTSSTDWKSSQPSLTVGTATVVRPVVEYTKAYVSAATSKNSGTYHTTQYTYTFWSGTSTDPLVITPKKIVTTLPAVTSNGSGSSNTTERYLNKDGTTAFTKAADGIYAYSEYNSHGQLSKTIQDPKSGSSETAMNTAANSSNFNITLPAGGLHLVTTYTYDAQGRLETTTLPDGRVTKNFTTVLADGRIARLAIPRVDSGTTYYGPVTYTVANQAGQAEFSATLGIVGGSTTTAPSSWLNTSTADAMTAPLSGSGSFGSSNCTLSGITTTVYSSDGHKRLASRVYFANPSSLPGTSGTHYDETAYGYDDMGRNRRVLAATGTIQRTVYDTLGRATERWIGTNDSGFAGGSSSGTDNMVKTDATQYDGGNSGGNSLVTQRTLDADGNWAGTTDQRVTAFKHDGRGRVVATIHPLAPHGVTNYDNLGRATSTAQFSSSSGLDGNSSTSTTTNRIALMETAFDEMGRVYLSTRYKVLQATGALEGTSPNYTRLETNTWYDAAGRVIKVKGEGGISKTQYDRLGRTLKRFTISKDLNSGGTATETAYADAADVAGDVVLEETISNYGNTDSSMSGKVMMSATIQRWHDDTTNFGDLDTNADADDNLLTESNIKGRISIAVSFSDPLGRTTDTVAYGSNGMTGSGSANFDLTPSSAWLTPATRSASVVRTSTVYDINGTVLTVESPGTPGNLTATTGITTKYLYDDGQRKTAEVRNFQGGATTNAVRDTDLYTRYEYLNGLMKSMWVDLDADGTKDTDDQVTEYTYGTTKGTSAGDSNIATGHLLQKVTYPDSSSGTDVVTFAYNAQSQQMWTKDQAGSVLETDYDTLGRQTDRRATTIASGLDATIKRITTAYLARGLVDTVTQYDNASKTSGTAKDQVQYSYDDWGNLTKFEQDVDSVISGGGAGGRAAFSVQYAWIKRTAADGFTTLVRDTMTMPDGKALTYSYDDANRVSKIDDPSVTLAVYEYLGAGQLVGTTLDEPNVFSKLYISGSPHAYGNLDEFGRVTKSTWTNGVSGGTDFYHVELSYDLIGNIMVAKDTIHADTSGVRRFDASYGMDALSRLTRAEEGNWNGTSISTARRDEQWKDGSGNLKLSQTGNWLRHRLDLNADGSYTGTGEVDDTGTFNTANEWGTRDLDSNSGTTGNNYTLAHDAIGNMTDDGYKYAYVYDVFGRLASVTSRGGSPVTIAEYKYNGLGYRIGWHYDADADNTLESGSPGDDPWYWFAYDERWRTVATYRYTDSDPKEQYIYHAAGARGLGGSSYIDSVVLRDRDIDSGWRSAGDGTLEERRYYAQNWRADVSVILPSTGCDASSGPGILEWIKYSAYGVPQAFSMADYNRDGTANSSDFNGSTGAFDVDFSAGNPRADVNFDGGVTIDDFLLIAGAAGEAAGRGTQSCASTANRIGYAGYVWDPVVSVNHVRHRVYVPELGRWTRRDPLGYVDGMSLYEYVVSMPIDSVDPEGTECRRYNRCSGDGPVNPPSGGSRGDRRRDPPIGGVEPGPVTPPPPTAPPTTNPSPVPSLPPNWPTDTLSCTDELNRALADPEVRAAWDRANQACGNGWLAVNLRVFCDRDCQSGEAARTEYVCASRGFGTVSEIVIRLCSNMSDLRANLLHELTHVAQACRAGLRDRQCTRFWDSFYNCRTNICWELQAFDAEGACRNAPNRKLCLCSHACGSSTLTGVCPSRTCDQMCRDQVYDECLGGSGGGSPRGGSPSNGTY